MVDDTRGVAVSMRIAALKTRLMELYTAQEAHHWLYHPQRVFDGHCPIDMLSDVLGYLEVDNVVDQMLDCVYV